MGSMEPKHTERKSKIGRIFGGCLSLRISSYSWLEYEIKESLSNQALVPERQASNVQGTTAEP